MREPQKNKHKNNGLPPSELYDKDHKARNNREGERSGDAYAKTLAYLVQPVRFVLAFHDFVCEIWIDLS